MIAELNWQTLEERRRIARLQMFHKIHYQYVAVSMPLAPKNHLLPTRKENMLAYNIPASNCDYHLYSFFPRTVRDWNILPQDLVQLTSVESFRDAILLV